MTSPLVELTPGEMTVAANVGVMRQVHNLAKGREDQCSQVAANGWEAHVVGALGEFAFAKYLGVFWSGAVRFRATDVGLYEVRTTHHPRGCLIIREGDDDDAEFVLLTGRDGRYHVRGTMRAGEARYRAGEEPDSSAQSAEWWRDEDGRGIPAIFVPQTALYPPPLQVRSDGEAVTF